MLMWVIVCQMLKLNAFINIQSEWLDLKIIAYKLLSIKLIKY